MESNQTPPTNISRFTFTGVVIYSIFTCRSIQTWIIDAVISIRFTVLP